MVETPIATTAEGDVDYSNMFLYAGSGIPDMSDMTVYSKSLDSVHGYPVVSRIIGSSHYISVPGIEYYEISSCRPIDVIGDTDPQIDHYDITDPIHETVRTNVDGYHVRTQVNSHKHDVIDVSGWKQVYTFEGDGPSAPTAVDVGPDGWVTLHCYPEFDVDIVTKTVLYEDRNA